jgi:hypothetical protein
MCISTNKISLVVLTPKKKLEIRKNVKTVKDPKKKTHVLCHETEPNPSKDTAMREIILRVEMNS